MSQTALLMVICWGVNPLATKPASEPAKPLDLHPVERNIIQYTNQERERYGLPRLRVDGRLMASARRHCAWMARNFVLQHTSAWVAENIAMGQRTSREVVSDWMTSPGHRANILHAGYRRIGVAAYTASDGTIYWCQQFLPGDLREETPTEEDDTSAGVAASDPSPSADSGETSANRTAQASTTSGASQQPSQQPQK